MKNIIEAFINGKHYAYYGGYDEYNCVHKWADNKKDAKVYTGTERLKDILYDLALLEHDYSALKFDTIEIKE